MRITVVGAVLIVATVVVAFLLIRALAEKRKRDGEQGAAK